MSRIREDIKKFCTEHGITAKDLSVMAKTVSKEERESEIVAAVEANNTFCSKYYKEKLYNDLNRFHYIVSPASLSTSNVESLSFIEMPSKFFHKLKDSQVLGAISFESFTIKHIPTSDLSSFEEIDKSEYDKAAVQFVNSMLNMKW